ncbi:MAG TPA: arginase family protein [Vicinamibacterales bacterium]|jgi:arginase|nr:arginase family protein [Vicinamibacterales bacterium]
MNRPIAIVGAPSSIGIRPYDDGNQRRLDLAPGVLREQRIAARVGARDHGDVVPPPYRDFVRQGLRPRNEESIAVYSRALAGRVAAAAESGAFVVVLGGDCSIVLGCLLGVRKAGRGPVGLAYVDAHADFASPEESRTGSAASMCLALAAGRGETPLARLAGSEPLTRPENVVLIGRRDHAEPWYGHDALRASAILDLSGAAVRERGPAASARAALERLAPPRASSFWIHVDADVLDPSVVPAVDSPTPGGLELEELAQLLTFLVRHPSALGMELTIYDPALDPERTSAANLARLMERVLGDDRD